MLTQDLPRVLQVERAALLLPDVHHLVSVDGIRLPASHAAVCWAASGGEAQSVERGRLRELVEQGPADLAWAHTWVPLMCGIDLRGLWLLGAREGKRVGQALLEQSGQMFGLWHQGGFFLIRGRIPCVGTVLYLSCF